LLTPYGGYNATVRAAAVAQGVAIGRTIVEKNTSLPFVDAMGVYARSLNASTNVATLLATIKAQTDLGFVVPLYLHNVLASGATGSHVNYADFCTLIDALVALDGIPCLTMSELDDLRSGPVVVTLPHEAS